MKVNVLIDSYGWIEHFSQGPLATKYAKHVESASKKTHFTPTVVLYEVYKRIKKMKGEAEALSAYGHIVAHTTVVSLNKKISLEAADISLKENLGMADSILVATAQFTGSEIITSDRHFEGKKNVIFIKPKTSGEETAK